jgi:maltose alpha-D-glucosyltransferase/alpha-amylase
MVTDEERAYMYEQYANEPRMKANVGIRRRLAPLLDNDRRQLELVNALLLSLPGSPVLYYGDEIGMGDNIWLNDRDGVRTPMQWNPDRNAGFSQCDPGRMYLPAIMDPVYGYQRTNVETQMKDSSSLLHWTKRMIQLRKENPAFGLGTYIAIESSNPAVIAYVRHLNAAKSPGGRESIVLCVMNLSRYPQPTELDLARFQATEPVELIGGVPFRKIGDVPYPLTMSGHGFFWFRLDERD